MHHDPNTERQLLAFLHLLAGYRDEAADIYNAMANGYDQFAATWDETFAGDAIEHLLRVCQENAPLRPVVLDAGCGTGRRIPDLITYLDPSELHALDISLPMLETARRKIFTQPVNFVHGNIANIPFADNSFDVVFASWVLETMGNPGKAVQELSLHTHLLNCPTRKMTYQNWKSVHWLSRHNIYRMRSIQIECHITPASIPPSSSSTKGLSPR